MPKIELHRWKVCSFFSLFLIICICSHASAYAIEYHGSLIEQALSEDGFNSDAINLAQSMSFLNDLGQQTLGSEDYNMANRMLVWNGGKESALFADRTHFDDKCNYTLVRNEWDRLEANTYKAVKTAESKGDIPGFLTIMGISLHNVQDFYSHSNWAELSEEGKWQSNRSPTLSPIDATWFDVPESVKENAQPIYTHCGNHDELNKDYAGRPHFETSYREAYYASVQWIDLIHSWVSVDFWRNATQYRGKPENCVAIPVNNQGEELPPFVWNRIRKLCWYTGTWNDKKDVSFGMKVDAIRQELGFDSVPACYYTHYNAYIPIIAAKEQLVPQSAFPHDYSKVVPKKWLKIQTNRVTQTDCDDFDIDPGAEEADFFSIIQVDSIGYIEAPVFDDDDINPKNWMTLVPLNENNPINIRYEIWDDDDVFLSVKGDDDQCDVEWEEGKKSWTYYGIPEGLENVKVITHGERGKVQYCFIWCWGCYQTVGDGNEAEAEFDVSLSKPPYLDSDVQRHRAPQVPDNPELTLTADPYTVFLPNTMSFNGGLSGYRKTPYKKIVLQKGHYVPTSGLIDGHLTITGGWVADEVIWTTTMNTYGGGDFSFAYSPSSNSSYQAYAEDQEGERIATSNIVNILVLPPQPASEPSPATCDDNNKCTVNDRYSDRVCYGDPLDCNDGNPDTLDSCNPSTGCVFTRIDKIPLDNTPCSDGNSCTVNDYYLKGVCMGGQVQNCDDGNPDTIDSCNPSRGCVFTRSGKIPADYSPCDDGNLCSVNDYYLGGVCQRGQSQNCDDGNSQTTDSCDPARGCVFTPISPKPACPEPCECLYEYEAKLKFTAYTKCSENPCYIDTSRASALSAKYCFKPA